jgi:hypothetical protein
MALVASLPHQVGETIRGTKLSQLQVLLYTQAALECWGLMLDMN